MSVLIHLQQSLEGVTCGSTTFIFQVRGSGKMRFNLLMYVLMLFNLMYFQCIGQTLFLFFYSKRFWLVLLVLLFLQYQYLFWQCPVMVNFHLTNQCYPPDEVSLAEAFDF